MHINTTQHNSIINTSYYQHTTRIDRVGDVRKIAAYTDSKRIPKAASGKILRWKNPCLHQFMDGSNGARIEEEDLDDITIADN